MTQPSLVPQKAANAPLLTAMLHSFAAPFAFGVFALDAQGGVTSCLPISVQIESGPSLALCCRLAAAHVRARSADARICFYFVLSNCFSSADAHAYGQQCAAAAQLDAAATWVCCVCVDGSEFCFEFKPLCEGERAQCTTQRLGAEERAALRAHVEERAARSFVADVKLALRSARHVPGSVYAM